METVQDALNNGWGFEILSYSNEISGYETSLGDENDGIPSIVLSFSKSSDFHDAVTLFLNNGISCGVDFSTLTLTQMGVQRKVTDSDVLSWLVKSATNNRLNILVEYSELVDVDFVEILIELYIAYALSKTIRYGRILDVTDEMRELILDFS